MLLMCLLGNKQLFNHLKLDVKVHNTKAHRHQIKYFVRESMFNPLDIKPLNVMKITKR